jgi:RNase P protein component
MKRLSKDLTRHTRLAEQANIFSSRAELAHLRNAKYLRELHELLSDAKKKESESCVSNFVYTRVGFFPQH